MSGLGVSVVWSAEPHSALTVVCCVGSLVALTGLPVENKLDEFQHDCCENDREEQSEVFHGSIHPAYLTAGNT